MAKPTLLPDPTCLHLHLLDGSSTAITAVVTTTSLRGRMPSLSSVFDPDSLSLCASDRRSALDGLRGPPAATRAPLFLL